MSKTKLAANTNVSFYHAKKDISKELFELKPNRIAVAYVGADWHTFIDVNELKEIVLSPTAGSNPSAIREIIKEKGIDNVHFLDNLHSKIFIADSAAIVGSSNLSSNALGLNSNGLHEAVVKMEGEEICSELNTLFEQYRDKARIMYPNIFAKGKQLERLEVLWNKQERHGLRTVDANSHVDICNFDYAQWQRVNSGARIHIAWWSESNDGYDCEAFSKHYSKTISPDYFEEFINNSLDFSDKDKSIIRSEDWLLIWQLKKDNTAAKVGMEWVHVHDYILNGSDDDDYPNVAVELTSEPTPPLPFKLDKAVKSVICDTLNTDEFYSLTPTKKEMKTWCLRKVYKKDEEITSRFLEHVKESLLATNT